MDGWGVDLEGSSGRDVSLRGRYSVCVPPACSPWLNLCQIYTFNKASLVAQTVKNPSAIHKTWVRSLGREDPLEEGMATHSGILAWRICMDRGAWQATVHGVTKSRTRLSG